eukprot:7292625-Prymnesium_polylepis.1
MELGWRTGIAASSCCCVLLASAGVGGDACCDSGMRKEDCSAIRANWARSSSPDASGRLGGWAAHNTECAPQDWPIGVSIECGSQHGFIP